ncbi:transposase [Pseudoalteromonas sp. SWN29]|uniref:transposase n=1 Tax=Pseudoalteromonas sp. SWN29 TaxID=2792064 RepID=UPI001E40CBB1|nr:transposase [Pseudoalteromonas sp. SWN29]
MQRQLARRNKCSNRWNKTKQCINKLHGKTSRQRFNFAYKTLRQIANENEILVFEDLNVQRCKSLMAVCWPPKSCR